mmetsp:Transcript_37757/g.66452  ORF Transcript_37757/g.66452 Transcript_37757/m.66452 type:complete len:296 (+) Transcript_37757:32-919(+)
MSVIAQNEDPNNSLAGVIMSLPHIIQLELVTFDLLVGLPLSQMVQVSRSLKLALENHSELGKSAKAAMPNIHLGPALLEPRGRLALLGLCAPLRRVKVMNSPRIEIDTVEKARVLSKIAHCASRSAGRVASRGSTACATVGQFFFSTCKADLRSKIAVSHPVNLPISTAVAEAIGLDEPALELSLAWGPRGIFVKGKVADSSAVVIDIYCKHPALRVDQRRGVVSLNGAWQKAGIGVCFTTGSKTAVLAAMERGILFAISIGDARRGAACFDEDLKKLIVALSLDLSNLIPFKKL